MFILLLLSSIVFSACKKDENDTQNNNDPIPGEGSRLSGWKYYEDGVFATDVILSYSGNKLVKVAYYDQFKNTGEDRIMTVEYQGNLVVVIDRWPDGNGGFAIDGKKTVEFSGNNVKEILEYDYINGNFQLDYQSTYTYINDRISECVYHYGGNPAPNGKYVNKYLGSQLVLSEFYDFDGTNFISSHRAKWQYDGDKISLIEYQDKLDTLWMDYSKSEFSYQGNIVYMNDYEYTGNSWNLVYETEITIDANGNTIMVVERDHTPGWEEEIKIEFSYTNGSGNFEDVILYPEDKSFPFITPFKKKAQTRNRKR